MAQMDTAIVAIPWYRSLNRDQWKVLFASNLGWLFDGFEIYALFLTVGFALHQLLDAAQYTDIPRYAGYILATTVFGWATGGVIGGIISDYDPRLFGDDRAQRLCLGLDVLRRAAFPRRRGDRLGMGDRRLDRLRDVAGPCARQGRRPLAVRRRHRQHPRFRDLAADDL